jgi:hypothetical protein
MDVQYTIVVRNTHLKDADMAAKVAAIDITQVEQEREDDFVVHTDVTPSPPATSGRIHRVITATLTADFLSKTDTGDPAKTIDVRLAALSGAFKNVFSMQLPAYNVFETPILV